MYAWADDEVTLYITVKDAMKLAKLPSKKEDWFVQEKLVMDKAAEPDDTLVKITFGRSRDHKI